MQGRWEQVNGQWAWHYWGTNSMGAYEQGFVGNPASTPGVGYNGEPMPGGGTAYQGPRPNDPPPSVVSPPPPGGGSPGGGGGGYQAPAPYQPPAPSSSQAQAQAPQLGTAPAPGEGLTPEQQSAKATIDSFLSRYGLQSLGAWAWQEYLNGKPFELIQIEIRDRPEYKARFPAMAALSAKGRAISEQQYVDYERSAAQIFSFAGLNHFVTPAYLESIIAGEVSLNELEWRITEGYGEVVNAPPAVRQKFAEWFGPQGDTALAAWFLDADHTQPFIDDAVDTARAGGYADFFGFKMTKEGAKLIGDIAPTSQALVAGFQEAIQFKPLTIETITEKTDLSDDEAVQAAFGTGGQALYEFQRRLEKRAAESRGGGGFLTTQEGIVGAGVASQ